MVSCLDTLISGSDLIVVFASTYPVAVKITVADGEVSTVRALHRAFILHSFIRTIGIIQFVASFLVIVLIFHSIIVLFV